MNYEHPLEETATLYAVLENNEATLDIDVLNDNTGHVVSTELLNKAVKGLEVELGGDALTRKWFPVLYR